MFRAIKRLFIYLGLLAEKATENDAINEAVVERGIRDNKEKAKRANDANGALAGQIGLLKEQLKKENRKREELQGLLQGAIAVNDENEGAHLAEELSNLEQEIADNTAQVENLDGVYKQNLNIVAESLREIQKFQREFEALKARVKVSKSLQGLSGMMESSVTELQGMMGGEMSQSMDQLRQSAALGEGRMRATMDLAKEMGSNISREQDARKARGKALFAEYKKKMGMVQPEAAAQPAPATPAAPERQKISET